MAPSSLDAAAAEDLMTEPPGPPDAGPKASRERDALNVLYVEDYAPVATLVCDTFRRRAPEIHVEVVPTVAQAIERLTLFEHGSPGVAGPSPRYDIVLSDLNLSDGLGLEVLAHVRSRGLFLAVVILTASVEDDTLQGALRAGADGYVLKRDDYLAQLPGALHAAVQSFRSRSESPAVRG
jgi:CheY-like chemotaxis protein